MRPLVAVTTTVVPEAGPYRRPQLTLYEVYVSVLERHGLASVLITPAHAVASIPDLLDHCSGLVLTGGEDIDPAYYGEEPIPELGITNRQRDEAELFVLELALERGMPILGICRGCQLLNVKLGGTLYQDLTAQREESLGHIQSEPWERRTHHVKIRPGSRLERIVGDREMLINSFHHQGIKDVAPDLRVVALAEDGTVEAVESDTHTWLLGVQWHPERHEATAPTTDPDRRIFTAFRDAVLEWHGRTEQEAA